MCTRTFALTFLAVCLVVGCGQPEHHKHSTYEAGLKGAEESGRRMLIYFNGLACVNCRKMEGNVIREDDRNTMYGRYEFVDLKVDDRTLLAEQEMYTSSLSGDTIKAIGQRNLDLQRSEFGTDMQPYFVVKNANSTTIATLGYEPSIEAFEEFINKNYD